MDIEKTPLWRPRMSEVHWLSEGAPGLGRRFQVVVRAIGLTVRSEPEIVEWDPPYAVTYRRSNGPAQMESFMEWVPDGEDCRFMSGGKTSGVGCPGVS